MFTVFFIYIQLLHTRGVHFPLHVRITGITIEIAGPDSTEGWLHTTKHNTVCRSPSGIAAIWRTTITHGSDRTVCKCKCWSTFKRHKDAIFAQFLIIAIHKYYNWSTVLFIYFYWMIFQSVRSAEEFSLFLIFFHIDFYIWKERKKEHPLLLGWTWKACCPLQRVAALVVCSNLKELHLGSAPWHSRKLWCCYSEI